MSTSPQLPRKTTSGDRRSTSSSGSSNDRWARRRSNKEYVPETWTQTIRNAFFLTIALTIVYAGAVILVTSLLWLTIPATRGFMR